MVLLKKSIFPFNVVLLWPMIQNCSLNPLQTLCPIKLALRSEKNMVTLGVRQGAVVGPLLFYSSINSLFYIAGRS